MESTEKKLRGKAIVISVLSAAIVATGLTWLRYTAQAPSTTSARLIRDRVVFATFDAHAARNIGEGTQAIVTFESFDEKRFTGAVQSLKTADSKTNVVIVLDELPPNVHPQTPCDVTVDTSIAREVPPAD